MMETSPEIDKLADALAKAQGQFAKAERSRTNTNFKSKYATHADIVDAIRTPLSENGLAFMQSPVDGPDGGAITVETFLVHSSGQWIKGYITLAIGRFAAGGVKTIDAQAYMSGFTSAKRIGLTALCGVSLDEGDAEDDGNAAAAQGGREYQPQQNGQAARPTQNGNGYARNEKPQNYPINLDAINEIKALCGAAYDVETTSQDWFGKSLQNLTGAQGAEFIRDMTAQRERNRMALLETPTPLEMVGEDTAPPPPSVSEQTMGAMAR